MGTRFMATKEAPIHESIKKELVTATKRDTALIMRNIQKHRTHLQGTHSLETRIIEK